MKRRKSVSVKCGALRPGGAWVTGAIVVVFFVAAQARAGILTIDNFTQPGTATFFALGTGTNPTKTISQTVSGAIGGQRNVLINVMGQGKPNSATGLIGHDTDFDVDALQVATNGIAPTLTTVQYAGLETISPTGLNNAHALNAGVGVDLTNGGKNDHFLLQFLFCDASPTAGLGFTINITSPGGKSSTTKMELAPNSATTYSESVPFSDLVGNANPNSVDSITFVFNGGLTPNVDYMLQLVGTGSAVPEPTSGLLMAIALGLVAWPAWGGRRWRSRGRSSIMD